MSDPADAPVIVLGAARSGTKFLRDLLGSRGDFAKVPYDVNYVWRAPQSATPHDRLDPALLRQKDIARIRATLDKIAGRKSGATLLEKTVSNTLRVPYVSAIYPEARYLHIIRDGRAVAESSFRMWQAPPDTGGLKRKLKDLPLSYWNYAGWFALNYAKGRLQGRGGGKIWGPRYPGIDEDLAALPLMNVVARQWSRSIEICSEDLKAVPAARVFEVRYEELVTNPDKVAELSRFAGVADPSAIVADFYKRVDKSGLDKWRAALKPDEIAAIENEQAGLLARHGYQ